MSPHAALYLAERTVDDRLRVSAAFLARARSVAAAWGAGPLADAALREQLGAEAVAAAHRMDVSASMTALAGAVARALEGPARR